MLYAVLASIWLFSLLLAFWLGFYIRSIVNRLKQAEKALKTIVEAKKKKPASEEPKSSFIDMDDPAQRIKWEHDQIIKKLNPYPDEE